MKLQVTGTAVETKRRIQTQKGTPIPDRGTAGTPILDRGTTRDISTEGL